MMSFINKHKHYIVAILVVVLMIATLILIECSYSSNYERQAKVLYQCKEDVFCVDNDGNYWRFEANDGYVYKEGTILTLIMYTNRTDYIQDDKVIGIK